MNDKVLKFNARISNYEKLNEQFMKVKINICHKGKNANYTDFTDEAMKELASTVLGVPVVGEFDTDKREFKGHGGKLVIEDDKVEWMRTTQPYGFVPMDQEVFYETVLEPDGLTQNEYLTVYAILWTELYPELFEAFEKKVHQSMEIKVKSSTWDENGEYCIIKKASMMALCLLQSVKPCFKGSIATNQFSEQDFEAKYQSLIHSYQQYALGVDGGDTMEETKDLTPEMEVETTEEFTESTLTNTITTTEEEETPEKEFEEEVEVEEEKEEDEAKDVPDADLDSEEEDKEVETEEEEVEDYQAKYEALLNEHTALTTTYQALVETYQALIEDCEALKTFKEEVLAERRRVAEEALFERFNELEDFDGFKELKAQAAQFSLEELETQLFALMGRKTYSLKQPTPSRPKSVVFEGTSLKSTTPNLFGLLDEFINI